MYTRRTRCRLSSCSTTSNFSYKTTTACPLRPHYPQPPPTMSTLAHHFANVFTKKTKSAVRVQYIRTSWLCTGGERLCEKGPLPHIISLTLTCGRQRGSLLIPMLLLSSPPLLLHHLLRFFSSFFSPFLTPFFFSYNKV